MISATNTRATSDSSQLQQIIDALNIFVGVGNVCEIRALGVDGRKGRTDAGYFDDFEMAARAVLSIHNANGVYFVMNAANPALLARAANRIKQYAELTTSDKDIIRRRWLLVDCDPVRPSGISASDEELNAALARANDVIDWMMTQGYPEPILAKSGNGAHVQFPVDLPNDEDSTQLVKSILQAVDAKFTDASVVIDTGVYNAARICRLYGTVARKGDSIKSRPHRMSELLYVPSHLKGEKQQ
jgi:hypothetical protein